MNRKAFEHTKRYVLISQEWGVDIFKLPSLWVKESKFEADTLEELKPEIEMIKEIYQDIKRPDENIPTFNKVNKDGYRERTARSSNTGLYCICDNIYNKNYIYDKDHYWWGYLVLDFKLNKPIEVGGVGLETYSYPHKTGNLLFMDSIFRKPGEVPENYKWDEGEYYGWLNFRWGNGKNAIEKKSEKNKKFPQPSVEDPVEIEEDLLYEEIENDFDKKRRD